MAWQFCGSQNVIANSHRSGWGDGAIPRGRATRGVLCIGTTRTHDEAIPEVRSARSAIADRPPRGHIRIRA